MSRFIASAVLAACLMVPALAAPSAAPATLVDESGGFSYVPPPGWHVRSFPGMKYKISYGKPTDRFAPNINVVDETAALPLADYARFSQKQMQRLFPGFHLLSVSPFVTTRGLRGFRMRAEASPTGRKLRQTSYLFAGHGDRKVIVTASWLAVDGSKYDGAVDAAIKTFTLK